MVRRRASEHVLTRAVQSYEQLSDYTALWKRVREMNDNGMSHTAIAACLNTEGYRPPKRAERFTGMMVSGLLAKQGRSGPRPAALSARGLLKKGEWVVTDLARKLSMPAATLRRWRQAGWCACAKLAIPGGLWAYWAPPSELRRLSKLREHQETQSRGPIDPKLTTPMSNKSVPA